MNIKHKDTSIFYTDQGTGSPVILLHGFLENHTMWHNFLEELTISYRIICIDLLGHGKTDCIGYIHTMDDMAEAVNTVLTHLEINKVQIIGHSMGGYVGLAFAKAYPDKITGLCLLNATPEQDSEERKKLRKRAIEMAKTQYNQLVHMSFVNLFDRTTKEQHPLEVKNALQEALKTPVQGFIAGHSGMSLREDFITLFKNFAFKTGMILGKTDLIINTEKHLANYKSHVDFFQIIDSGHMSHISKKLDTNRAILKFLAL